MRNRVLTLFLLLVGLLSPRFATGAGFAPPAPADGLTAGALVTTTLVPLPRGVHEFELVLLPDSGPAVQVTPELPAGVREVTWRVPRTLSRRFRLAVRFGGAHDERQSEPSEPFELAPLRAEELARLVAGETDRILWNTGTAVPPGLAPAGDKDQLADSDSRAREAETVSGPCLLQPSADVPRELQNCNEHDRPIVHQSFNRTPAWTPLRN